MKKAGSTRANKDVITVETDDTTCPVCYAEFLDPEDLDVHTQQVHNKGFMRCQFCEKSFQNAEIYILHFRDVHLADIKSCQYCSRVYTDVDAFRNHEIRHTRLTPKNKYSCSQCRILFLSVFELTQHEYENHPTVEGNGVFLNKYYSLLSSVINMKADNVIQAIGKDFIYVCARCKHSDADLRGYIAHLKVKNCRSLACDRCYKVYSRVTIMREHYSKNCSNEEPKKKKCEECLKFFDLKTLKHHKKTCKAIKCNNCRQLFESLFDLSEHQHKEHPLAVSLLVCIFCHKECVGSNALDKHIDRTHSHEFHLYKYTCSYCETTFKHPKRLFTHYFMKHKDIEPYTCKICDKTFRIRKNFTLHIKLVHSSNGFVEFDEKLHVFFTDKKSEKPFQPVSKYGEKPKNKELDKSAENDELELVNNSDFMNPTDTEGNQTDVNQENQDTEKHKRKRKTRPHYNQKEIATIISDDEDSEDEPLNVVQKRVKMKNQIKSQLRKTDRLWNKKHVKLNAKKRFTCRICKKYCYTFQNYHNHVSMHFKDESKRCVKCSLSFKSKAELQRHLVDQHSSSKLTETLKNLLERRKKIEQKEEPSMTKKFINTIKAVKLEKDTVTAKITPVTKEISVQKFIENFTPETNENKVQVKNNFSVTKVVAPKRQPLIKMTKFKPAPLINEDNIKLAMPVRFKKVNEKHTVTIKEVKDEEYESKLKLYYEIDDGGQFQDDYNNEEDFSIQNQKESYIPEVEQEVTLEGTEEVPKKNVAAHKIVIPKLPKELKSIRIAHLQPEAPYYKIVKMEEIIHTPVKKEEEVTISKDTPVQLPDGTKLVHVNPLAHLLGNTPIENLIKPVNKYYKPKNKNFQEALAKAMQKLDDTSRRSKKKGEKAKAKKAENTSNIETSTEDKPKIDIDINTEHTSPTDVIIEPEDNNDTNKGEDNNETAVNTEASNQTDVNETEVNESYHQSKEVSASLPIIAD